MQVCIALFNSFSLIKLRGYMPMMRTGDCLLSSGDDGAVRFWKKSLSGEWVEFAETTMADEYVPLH